MGYYAGRKVLVVGGSKGIGRALAVRLAREGASVWVAARGAAELEDTVRELKAAGPTGVHGYLTMDVTDREAVLRSAEDALERMGGLDVLVCNSGYALPQLFLDAPADDFDKMMAVNFHGHVNVVRAFAPAMVAARRGDICLVSSMMGFMPLFGYTAYSASKFAVVGFAESLRQEMKQHGVRVTVYYPPTTETPGLSEENKSKPPAVWALESGSGWNKVYKSDEVAASIAGCIERGTVHGMIGMDSKLIFTLNRHLPMIARYLTDDEVAKAIKKAAGTS
jgi:NAD(P)-dependent dehydrogenase (short-subunit alcohol dehydrogenase family)